MDIATVSQMLINDGCTYDLGRIGFCQADVDIAVELAELSPTNADIQDENYLFENFPPYQKADSLNTRRRWAIAQAAVLIAAKAKPESVRYEDLEIGDFFRAEADFGTPYQKREYNGPIGRTTKGYNTRTGKMEHCFGRVYRCEPLTEEQIAHEQADHEMWGQLAVSHDRILNADIA